MSMVNQAVGGHRMKVNFIVLIIPVELYSKELHERMFSNLFPWSILLGKSNRQMKYL